MRYFWFVIFVLSVGSVSAQNSARVRELEKQRKAALAEIEMTSQLLDETRQTARNSLNRLNLLSKQILSRKQVISLLNQEIGEIDKQIAASRRNISQLERELENKRQNYGKSVQSIYKRRSSQDKLLFILSADNFAQSLRRMRYLREYADWQKKQASEIIGKQKEIAGKQKELEKTRAEKNALLGAREDESRKLQTEESSQKEEVQQLNQKQKQLQADLKKKKQQADALNRQIEKQIAEEIARAEAEAKAARERAARAERNRLAREKAAASGKKVPETKPEADPVREERVADTKGGYAMTKAEKRLSDDFASNKGRLPYPVSGRHTIVATFGEQQHQELKYVRMHSTLGYEELKGQGYSDFILETILYHHENYDGSGFPSNLKEDEIPIGARILRICDVFAALISDRPYRRAFSWEKAVAIMIEEIKNFDLKLFLCFLEIIHDEIICERLRTCEQMKWDLEEDTLWQ